MNNNQLHIFKTKKELKKYVNDILQNGHNTVYGTISQRLHFSNGCIKYCRIADRIDPNYFRGMELYAIHGLELIKDYNLRKELIMCLEPSLIMKYMNIYCAITGGSSVSTSFTPCPSEWKREYPWQNNDSPGCEHKWASYTGLFESYEYCTKCDIKKEAGL